MTEAELHRSDAREAAFRVSIVARPLSQPIGSVVHRCLFRDSLYFLIAALAIAAMIGWLSFVTIAART